MKPTTDQMDIEEFYHYLKRVGRREHLTFAGAAFVFAAAASLPFGASQFVAAMAGCIGVGSLISAGALYLTEPKFVPLPEPPLPEEFDDDERPWN